MMKKPYTILILVLAVLASVVIVYELKPFYLLEESATITVVDLNGKAVIGATVTIEEIDDTWHWLGDVFDRVSMSAGMDGRIDEYDVNYTKGYFGDIDVNWADMNNDGKVDIRDISYVSVHVGLVRNSYPPNPTNITNTNGQVTFDIVYTHDGRAYDYYTITVTKDGYQTKIVTRNIRTAQTIVLEPLPKYTLTISSTTGGTTDPPPGSYSYTEGTTVQVSALPDANYQFAYWKLDGETRYDNPITILMNADHQLDAYFEIIPPPPPETYTLTISCTSGGTTDPPPGTYEYQEGTVATVTAIPDQDYKLDHWELDFQFYSTETTVSITMTQSYTLKAVFSLIPKPAITVLTVLKFPPSEEVNVEVFVTDQNNNPLPNQPVTMTIFDSMGNAIRQSSSSSGSDGKAVITITTPPSSGIYNATFAVNEIQVLTEKLTILPKILIVPSATYKRTQTYKPGDFDFIFDAQVKDTDGNMLTGFSVEKSLTDVESGQEITGADYLSFVIEGSRIYLRAKLYDWYKSQDSTFNYQEKIVRLEIQVSKPETHVEATFSDTVTMTAPYLVALVPSSVELGKTGITISIRDPYGNVPEGLTLDNVEVIIQTPSGVAYSTRNELAEKVNMLHGDISISFKFDEIGTYKLTLRFYNLPWEQPTSTYDITVTEKPQPYSIFTNIYFWAIIGIIVLIFLFRRRKKTEEGG